MHQSAPRVYIWRADGLHGYVADTIGNTTEAREYFEPGLPLARADGVLQTPAGTAKLAVSADWSLRYFLALALHYHRPGRRCPRWLVGQHDADVIAEFVERHKDRYSQVTRILARRLAKHWHVEPHWDTDTRRLLEMYDQGRSAPSVASLRRLVARQEDSLFFEQLD